MDAQDRDNKGNNLSSEEKCFGKKMKLPLPRFLRVLPRAALWKRGSGKCIIKSRAFYAEGSQNRRSSPSDVLILRGRLKTHRYEKDTSSKEASVDPKQGYESIMATRSFWTILAVLFLLGFLIFMTGFLTAIYFFKEAVHPTSDQNSWVENEKKKIGVGIEQTIEEEVWKQAGNTAFTRAVMPSSNTGALSLSQSERTGSSPTPVPSSSSLSGNKTSAGVGTPSSSSQRSSQGEEHPEPSTEVVPIQGDTTHPFSILSVQGEAVSSIHPNEQAGGVSPPQGKASSGMLGRDVHPKLDEKTQMEVKELIQNPNPHGHRPAYHTSPLSAPPTHDVHGVLLNKKPQEKKVFFMVNYGIFSTKDKAQLRIEKLKKLNLVGRIVEKEMGGKRTFLVVEGSYPTEQEAISALKKLPREATLLFSPRVQPMKSEMP